MASWKVAVGFTLVVLATFCGPTYSVVPRVNEYTPTVLQPVFDVLRRYGLERKNENENTRRWNQYLVVLMASHGEIMKDPPFNFNAENWKDELENHFKDRLRMLVNVKHTLPDLNPGRLLHGETNYIHNNMINPMLEAFRQKYGTSELPIILMYSHYIPCADVPRLGYSCAEELGVFATNNWKDFGLLVAFSTVYPKTNPDNSKGFMYLGGIPAFHYENSSKGEMLVADYTLNDADQSNRWRKVTFLQNFFDCLETEINGGCLPDNRQGRKAALAFFVNSIAYLCFKDRKFTWRRKQANVINNCVNDYLQGKIGTKCKQCSNTACVANKVQKVQRCLTTSVDGSLIPGGPDDPFDPFTSTWIVTRDITLDQIFHESPQHRRKQLKKEVFCKDKSLSLESQCTQ